jgi:hypothetical protein
LEALGKERECKVVREWAKNIVNHLYWVAATSTTGDEAIAKWLSIANHVHNLHEHDSWQFPMCLHEDLGTNRKKKWIEPCTKVSVRLTDIKRKGLLTDVGKRSPHHQTSSIEAFHGLILKFAPKNLIFSYKSMLCRLFLAALHYNENADRQHRVDKDGKLIYRVRFPKFKKGGYTAYPVKDAPTYSTYYMYLFCRFLDTLLIKVLCAEILQGTANLWAACRACKAGSKICSCGLVSLSCVC